MALTENLRRILQTPAGVDAFPFLAFFFGGVAGGVMRALEGSGDEGVASSVAEGLEEEGKSECRQVAVEGRSETL